MKIAYKRNGTLKKVKKVVLTLSNGDLYHLEEDIEGKLEIRKELSDTNENISINPRYTNTITVN